MLRFDSFLRESLFDMTIKNLFRCKKGAALLEYSLLAAGVSLIAAAGVSLLGHQTNDLIGAVAAIMPGAHADDNGPILSGKLIETTTNADGNIVVNVAAAAAGGPRLGNNIGVPDLGTTLIIEAE